MQIHENNTEMYKISNQKKKKERKRLEQDQEFGMQLNKNKNRSHLLYRQAANFTQNLANQTEKGNIAFYMVQNSIRLKIK